MTEVISPRQQQERDALYNLVIEVLLNFSLPESKTRTFQKLIFDSGPAVLVNLAAITNIINSELEDSVLSAWLDSVPEAALNYTGLFGGLAGLFVGTQLASSFHSKFTSIAIQLRGVLVENAIKGKNVDKVNWSDYDLIFGPSGIILALVTDPNCSAHLVLPITQHLAQLCDQNTLERLRVYSYLEDKQRSWNYGHINTGLAHGVGGVISALRAAIEIDTSLYKALKSPLQRACQWLVNESYIDELGLYTWSPAGLEGAPRPEKISCRQAWCYGTPGLAWTLWEAGRVLNDPTICGFAEKAMSSFCAVFDESLYIDSGLPNESLSICHGVAGMLAISDAFTIHANHAEARALAKKLEVYLLARMEEIRTLAYENMSLLSGASGVLAILLIRLYGGQRRWLYQLGLR